MTPKAKRSRLIRSAVLGLGIALLGYTFVLGGVRVLLKWDVISGDYAFCGVLWIAAGAVMIAGCPVTPARMALVL